MVQAFESAVGIRFSALGDTTFRAIIIGGPSNSGYRARPMRLRGSYPLETKQATLMRELGHRLGAGVFRPDENEHAMLFLWLSEAWEHAYGAAFTQVQVSVERRRGGIYPGAWDAALALRSTARAARWDSIKTARRAR